MREILPLHYCLIMTSVSEQAKLTAERRKVSRFLSLSLLRVGTEWRGRADYAIARVPKSVVCVCPSVNYTTDARVSFGGSQPFLPDFLIRWVFPATTARRSAISGNEW